MPSIATFLMFAREQHGKAEEAINLYVSLFENSKIVDLQRYGPDEGEPEGTLRHGTFSLSDQAFMAIDSSQEHSFTFTPAISLFVGCSTEEELDKIYAGLSTGGTVLMELGEYPFSDKFGWIADKYGVSWQLSLVKG